MTNVNFNKKSLSQKLVLFVPISFLVIFFLIPLFMLILFAFGLFDESGRFISLDYFVSVLIHPLNQYFLFWDIQQALITTFFCILLGLPASYIFVYYKIPGKNFLRQVLTIPFILPPIVVLMGFIQVFGHGSFINVIWRELTGFILIDIYNSYEGIILAHVFYNIPVVIRLAEIGWKTIDPDLIGVARTLKASKFSILVKIQIPHLLPVLAAASLLIFIYSFNSYAIVLVLGGVQYQTLEVRIYSLAKGLFDYNAAAALTVVQLIINIFVIIIYLYFSNKYEVPLESQFKIEKKTIFKFAITKREALEAVSIGIYFFLIFTIAILPIVGVVQASFFSSEGIFTLKYYNDLLDFSLRSYIGLPPLEMIFNSLLFAVSVMVLSTFLSLLLNYGLNYETTQKGTPKLTLASSLTGIIVILPMSISSVTLAFSLFILYHQTPLYGNIVIVIIIAQTLVAFPFANRIIAATRASIDPALVNVARSLGASRFRAFKNVELPLLIPGIIVAGLFSFAISIGEFGATNFLSRANFATIPIGIYKLINTRNIGAAAAFSTILVLLTVFAFIILEKFGRTEFKL
ncbi:MAG: ABC transporter permease [Candidatus Hodarchaeales archaeon]